MSIDDEEMLETGLSRSALACLAVAATSILSAAGICLAFVWVAAFLYDLFG